MKEQLILNMTKNDLESLCLISAAKKEKLKKGFLDVVKENIVWCQRERCIGQTLTFLAGVFNERKMLLYSANFNLLPACCLENKI